MRRLRHEHLLAGTVLALIAGTPVGAVAAPETIEMRLPQPSALPARRDIEPVTPRPVSIENPAAPATNDIKGSFDRPLAATDGQITEKLREMIAGKKIERRVERAPERAAVETVYSRRAYAPIWITDGKLNARAKIAIARMKGSTVDGLDPADYSVPDFGSLSNAEAIAEGDIELSNSVLNYARHLQIGRIAPTRVSIEVDYGNRAPDPADVLRRMADGSDVNVTLDNYNPPHAEFRALKAKLAELRASTGDGEATIPEGATVKIGMKDERVPQLRNRYGIAGKPNDLVYDKQLALAIQKVQINAGLTAKGVLDNATVKAINGPNRNQKVETVLANMERWRWVPRDLGRAYVMVNIPDFTLKVVKGGELVWRTKIVAGKPQTPTPLLSASMEQVIVNPSWYVPQSIIQNELLPLYESDPKIFERMGLEVKRGPDGHINVVQPPGAANALGHIKFTFPNKFQVYLHDTPEKKLFAHERRAFSHGCMRVEDPTKFGEVILSLANPGRNPDSRQIYAMYGKEEYPFKLANRPQVHLTYQTAYVDNGRLVVRDDLYGFDARIHSILGSDERRIADVAPPVDPKRDLATMKSNQDMLRRVERRETPNPLVFFERLFR